MNKSITQIHFSFLITLITLFILGNTAMYVYAQASENLDSYQEEEEEQTLEQLSYAPSMFWNTIFVVILVILAFSAYLFIKSRRKISKK